MEERVLQFNVAVYFLMMVMLASLVATSILSGHAWSLVCYQCMACNLNCPLGLDTAAYLRAALVNDPNLYMDAKNLELSLGEAFELDPKMVVSIDGEELTAEEALERYPNAERMRVKVVKLRVKDAAKLDPLDGLCETTCPIGLPITRIISDLKEDGKFRS